MRHFRKEITEFAIDPLHEPAGFLRQLWRYPVRLETALEYLRHIAGGIRPALLPRHRDAAAPGRLLLREAYGFPEDIIDDQPWTGDRPWRSPSSCARTGLTYCEFVELWECGFVPFQRARRGSGIRLPGLPAVLPGRPGDLFPEQADPLVALRELAVFIRLWRRLRGLPTGAVSLTELADICAVLHLFDAAARSTRSSSASWRRWSCCATLLCLPLTAARTFPMARPAPTAPSCWRFGSGPAAASWDWAVGRLIDGVEDTAEERNSGAG